MSKVNPENVADGKHTSGVRDAKAPTEGYPGRALPKAESVTTAESKTGVTIKCARQQTGENRYAINRHVEEKREFGPNN